MVRVLFVCIHNSARSQMAEAFVNHLGETRFHAESAGLEAGKLNMYVVEAMKEIGLDISASRTKTVDDVLRSGATFDHLITVCDGASKERCPFVPGVYHRYHWDIDDPSEFKGDHDTILKRIRTVRDAIQERVKKYIKTHQASNG
ncbi:MAG: arsenate reductase ArsC [Candidatus Izemoplasmatales bacterium]|nr:arsenate reductase ArsC [Candidatus Izemoplasmatales bacterium]